MIEATQMLHTIAIALKIPDNTAYSALTALRRLGINVERVERADIWQIETSQSQEATAEQVRRDESLFNPNKHQLALVPEKPRDGEVWIEELSPPRDEHSRKHYTAWRLYSGAGTPADGAIVRDAAEKLLCNPAIERAIF